MKQQAKRAILKSRLLSLAGRCLPQRIAILKYHSVQDDLGRYLHSLGPGIVHSTAAFRAQMEVVAQRFNPVSLDDVSMFLKQGKGLPPRPVAITFDDGFLDNAEIAAPILDRLGIPAAFYITVDPVETGGVPWFCRLRHAFATTSKKKWFDSIASCERNLQDPVDRKAAFSVASERCARTAGIALQQCVRTIERELEVDQLSDKLMMTWDHVRLLHKSGHIIGSHTVTHPNMAQVATSDLNRECVDSKAALEEKLSAPVTHFSYPSPILQPHWSEATVRATASAGYQVAVTSTAGPVKHGNCVLSLQRVVVPSEAEELAWILENSMLGRRFP